MSEDGLYKKIADKIQAEEDAKNKASTEKRLKEEEAKRKFYHEGSNWWNETLAPEVARAAADLSDCGVRIRTEGHAANPSTGVFKAAIIFTKEPKNDIVYIISTQKNTVSVQKDNSAIGQVPTFINLGGSINDLSYPEKLTSFIVTEALNKLLRA